MKKISRKTMNEIKSGKPGLTEKVGKLLEKYGYSKFVLYAADSNKNPAQYTTMTKPGMDFYEIMGLSGMLSADLNSRFNNRIPNADDIIAWLNMPNGKAVCEKIYDTLNNYEKEISGNK